MFRVDLYFYQQEESLINHTLSFSCFVLFDGTSQVLVKPQFMREERGERRVDITRRSLNLCFTGTAGPSSQVGQSSQTGSYNPEIWRDFSTATFSHSELPLGIGLDIQSRKVSLDFIYKYIY